MKSLILMATLLMMSLSSLFCQNYSEEESNCDFKSLLEEYKLQDSLNTITDPNLLFKMGLLASNVDESKWSESYYQRIVTDSTNFYKPIYYQTMGYLYLGYDKSINLDSLHYSAEKKLGADHEVLAIIDLIKADATHLKHENINLDSTVYNAISRIKNQAACKRIIAIALQDISMDYADKGKIKKGIQAAIEFEKFVVKYFPPCSETLSGAYVTRGRRYLDADHLDSASYFIKKSYFHSKKYHPEKINVLARGAINLSDVLDKKGDFNEALQLLQEAEKLAIQDSIIAKKLLPVIYNNYGGIYKKIGSANKAIEYYRKAILYADRESTEPSKNKISAYFNIGSQFHELKEFDLSEKYRRKALQNSIELLGEDHLFTAIILMSLGSLQFEQKNYEACEDYFARSLKIRKKIYGETHASLANVYFNYGDMYEDRKMFDKARYYTGLTLDIYKNHFGDQDPKVAHALLRKASIERGAGNFSKALVDIQTAKNIFINNGGYKGSSNSIIYLDLVNHEAGVKLDDLKKNRKGDINAITKNFEHVMEVFDYHIDITEEISDMSEYATDYPLLFDNYVESLILKTEIKNTKDDLWQAYQINDKGKNLGLLKSLKQRSELMFANVPKDKRNKLKKLKGKIQTINQKLAEVDPNQMSEQHVLLDSISNFQTALQVLNEQIKVDYPFYDRLKNTGKDLEVAAIIPPEGSGLAIIDYRVLDSALISFSLFNGKIVAFKRELSGNLNQKIESLLQAIIYQTDDAGAENVNQILIQAIENLPADINKIVIIPDEFLSGFPFEVLKIGDEFLINKYAISYANSASILKIQNSLNSKDHQYSFSGFAPQYEQSIDTTQFKAYASLVRSGNWELPFAQQEVKYIADLLDGNIFKDQQASKKNLMEALKSSKIVHLSMHAQADNETPMNSQFIFNAKKEEENLLLYELYNLQANASLAVLSACETGKGEFHTGDGVRSLGNGFLYAGVPSVVMSLWKVPDESTSKIMIAFYEHLKSGATKSEALRQAKLEYLDQVIAPQQKHPYYWAGFILSGNDDPINLDTGWSLKTIFLLAILLFVLLWTTYRRSK